MRRSTSASTTRKARELRHNATPAENLLWKHLRKTQIPKYKFTRQYPIGPYIVDFCCRWARLVVELDGGQHATQREADASRQQYLENQGYRVIRFWNNEVFENLEGVLFRIVEELEDVCGLASDARDPHPNPLPARERGHGAYPPALALARPAEPAARRPSAAPARPAPNGELEGGLVSGREGRSSMAPPPLVSDGTWVRVTEVEDLWKVNDEWWRGPEEEIARLYYALQLGNDQRLTVYLDLIANTWFRQPG